MQQIAQAFRAMRIARPNQRVDGFLHGVGHFESVQHEQPAHKSVRNNAHVLQSVALARK